MLTNAIDVVSGDYHSCALKPGGSVWCWGRDDYHQMGASGSDTRTPVQVPGISTAISLSAGANHTCAVLVDGSLTCWGRNTSGQVGRGTTSTYGDPAAATGLTGHVVGVAAGALFTCALKSDGTVVCFGDNGSGQLGINTTVSRATTPGTAAVGLSDVVEIAAGGNAACALHVDGNLDCWGQTAAGVVNRKPVAVPDGVKVARLETIAVGLSSVCTLRMDSSVMCWGDNVRGQLGDGTTTARPYAAPVLNLQKAKALAIGDTHACAVRSDGTVVCWGSNGHSQTGVATGYTYTTPVRMPTVSQAKGIATGTSHTCVLIDDGTVRCVGANEVGQVGKLPETESEVTPFLVPLGARATAISASHNQTCAVLITGNVQCWGSNDKCQLGNSATGSRGPVSAGLTNAVVVAAGFDHTCALLADGTMKCWGDGEYGKLGNGTTTNCLPPTLTSPVSGVIDLRAGHSHSCALTAPGGIYCWGYNGYGEIGDGTTTVRKTPVPTPITTGLAVGAGDNESCALLVDGTARCWGNNSQGRIGNGTTGGSVTTPTTVVDTSGGRPYTRVCTVAYGACAVGGDCCSRECVAGSCQPPVGCGVGYGASDPCKGGAGCQKMLCDGNGACSVAGGSVPDGSGCDDNNACTRTDTCTAGVCHGANSVACPAPDACHDPGTCNPATGQCTNAPAKANGTACNDSNACTRTDTCQAGACVGANPVACAALDECHVAGTCDPQTGACSNAPKTEGTACGNACTRGTCVAGTCTGATPVVCAALDQCHVAGTCDPQSGACSNPAKPNGSVCNDGNACTQSDSCQAGACVGTNPVACTALDQCHVAGTCDPQSGACSNPAKPNGSACNDGNACTQSDSCQAGTCVGASPVACAALDQCHVAGTCDPQSGACSNPAKPNGSVCNDGNACTQSDSCQTGACVGASPVVCLALDQCHDIGTCDTNTGVCSNPAKTNGTACNDGNACTQSDSCQTGACVGANPVACATPDQCHLAGTCDPQSGACSNPAKADGTACDDGNACTQSDTCQAGACAGANPVSCAAPDQCHLAGTCDPVTGECSNPAAKVDGTACDDGNGCTQSDTCQAGACVGANPKADGAACDDGNGCTQSDTCQAGACVGASPVVDGTTCNDGNGCTQTDTCRAGACVGTNPAADGTACNGSACTQAGSCHAGACVGASPVADGTTCNDGNGCTQTDTCQAGACVGSNPVGCAAPDQCHVAGTCDPGTGACSNPPKTDGTACDDANPSTQNDTCQAGVCAGASSVVCTALDQCHDVGTFDPATGRCTNPPKTDGSACDDGNVCTQADSCQAGACVGTSADTDGWWCNGNACTNWGLCQAGACVGAIPLANGTECDDGNPCTQANCQAGNCVVTAPSADGTACNDWNVCTQNDTCQSGLCRGAPADGTPCGGDACTQAGTCAAGACVGASAMADGTTCSSGECTQGTCQTGSCVGADPAPDGTSCVGQHYDRCAAYFFECAYGVCIPATSPVNCSTDTCHGSVCDPATGACNSPALPDGTACNDDNGCTRTDICQAGSCVGADPVICTALDQCHVAGACDPIRGCTNPAKPDGTVCDDENACTRSDSCHAGACAGDPVTCPGDQCHLAGTCDRSTGTCSNSAKPDGASCSDGNACTSADRCVAGTCTGNQSVFCSAPDQCHNPGTCNPATGQCINPPAKADGAACNDGNPCTLNDTCVAGACTAGSPVACTAPDQCHDPGTCSQATGTCINAPAKANGSACNDGNPCTQSDTCVAGVCTAGSRVVCVPDQCHNPGYCNDFSGHCIFDSVKMNGTACNDGNPCTQNDACQAGACVAGPPVACTARDQCHVAGTCDPGTGACSDPAKADGTACNDANACTRTDTCMAGTCTGANPVACAEPDQCHVAGTCNPTTGACSNPAKADGAACNDGNACTLSDTCQQGACAPGADVRCVAQDDCHLDGSCNPTSGACSIPTKPDGSACRDGNACTQADSCQSGACVGTNPVACAALDACHIAGTCDPATGQCSNPVNPGAPDGTACDDHNVCTTPDTCQAGTCVGGNPLAACDPSPVTGDEPFETRASLIGRVVAQDGTPVAGYSVKIYDAPVGSEGPRSDLNLRVAADGSFRARLTAFPETEPPRSAPHHVIVHIESPDALRAIRDAYLHPGVAEDIGTIVTTARDPKVTMIDASGGVATDSNNRVEVRFPPGAVSAAIDVRITPFAQRSHFPMPLPNNTATMYGFELEPDGQTFAVPVTVRLTNWRDFPTDFPMPVGYVDATRAMWLPLTQATWDGQKFAFETTHFTIFDANPPTLGRWLFIAHRGPSPNESQTKCGAGSQVGLSNGSLYEDIPFPGYQRAGRNYGVSLNYNSGLAGSRQPARPNSSTEPRRAVDHALVGVAMPSMTVEASCVTSNQLTCPPGASGASWGSVCTPGALISPFGQAVINIEAAGTTTTTTAPVSADAADLNVETPVLLPENDSSSTAAPGYVRSRTTLGVPSFVGSGGGITCVGSGMAFGISNSTVAPRGIPVEPGPVADVTRDVFMNHRHSSPFGSGWGVREIGRMYVNPSAEEVTVLSGNGQDETFSWRARMTNVPWAGNAGFARMVLARDPVTNERFEADNHGLIRKIAPDGTTTTVLSGLAFDGPPLGLAIAYVGGERRFVIAAYNQLTEVDAAGAARNLKSRSAEGTVVFYWASVAAIGDHVFYTDGFSPVVYSVSLSDPARSVVELNDPSGRSGVEGSLSLVGFQRPHGLAASADGTLFVADPPQNLVFEIRPDDLGQIGPESRVFYAVGDGSIATVPELGQRVPAAKFGLREPLQLSMSEDGYLWIKTVAGLAAFDTVSKEGRWAAFDAGMPGSEFVTPLFETSTSVLGLDASSTWVTDYNGNLMRVDGTLSSKYEPSRTISIDPTGATLVDTAARTIEAFDPTGRLVEKRDLTGEPILSVTYLDARSDRVHTITDATGGVMTFTYNGGKLQSVTDPAGHVTTVAINQQGDLVELTEPGGETFTFGYENHRITSKRSPRGDLTTYTYGDDGTVSTTSKPTGEHFQFASVSHEDQYDAAGHVIRTGSYTDARGVSHALTFNVRGDVETDAFTADGSSYVRSVVYAPVLNPIEVGGAGNYPTMKNFALRPAYTTLNGLQIDNFKAYDAFGRLAREEHSANSSAIADYRYDSNGLLSWVKRYPSNTTQMIDRDAAGHPIRFWDKGFFGAPTGREKTFAWRPDGQPATMTEHGVTTTFTYNAVTGMLAAMTDTLGRSASFARDEAGNVTGFNDGATSTTFTWDAKNRLTESRDADGNATTIGYLQSGCGCSESDAPATLHTPDLPPDKAWRFEYAPEGRLSMVTDPDGYAEVYDYDPTGELKQVIDRLGRPTSSVNDQQGRLRTLVDALGRTHARAYPMPNAAGWAGPDVLSGSASNTPATTDISAALANGQYQVGLNLLQPIDPAQVEFYRDATFELSNGMQFDLARRVTRRQDRVGTPIASSTVIAGAHSYLHELTGYNIDTADPLVGTQESDYPTTYQTGRISYNEQFDTTAASGWSGGPSVDYAYARDTGGRLTGASSWFFMEYPANSAVGESYAYLPNGRLSTVSDANGTQTITYDTRGLVGTVAIAGEGTYTYGYDQVGRNTSLTYPDGHVRVQGYDHQGRIVSRCYQYGGPANARCYGATYDAVGNPLTLTDPEGTDTVQYDALNRVSQVTRAAAGQPDQVETYAYNALGALKVNAGVALDDQRPRLAGGGTADSAVPNTLEGQPVTLDPGGRITAIKGTSLAYNQRGSMVGATTSTMQEAYGHDTYLRRITLESYPTGTANPFKFREYYVYDDRNGANIVGVYDSQESSGPRILVVPREAYLYDGIDHPLRRKTVAGAITYYELDLTGNVRRLRGAAGEDLGGYRYTAFGKAYPADATTPEPTLNQPLRWKGRPFDAVTGLYDMRARQWSPELGVFTQGDEFALLRTDSTLWGWPGQNPFRYLDPMGRWGIGFGGSGQLGFGYGFGVGFGVFFDFSGDSSGFYFSYGKGIGLGASVGGNLTYAQNGAAFWGPSKQTSITTELGGGSIARNPQTHALNSVGLDWGLGVAAMHLDQNTPFPEQPPNPLPYDPKAGCSSPRDAGLPECKSQEDECK